MISLTHITHILYDMDGLLLDTESLYTQVATTLCAQYGKVFDWSIKQHLIGRPSLDSATDLVHMLDLPITPEAYLETRQEKLSALFPSATLLPGVLELTTACHKLGIKQAIATSSNKDMYALKTSKHQAWIKENFDLVVTGDDPEINQGKPAPDIFLCAAKRLGASPQQCLVFEDSPAGVTAGLAAGMTVIAIPDQNLNPALVDKAHLVVDSMTAIKPDYFKEAVS